MLVSLRAMGRRTAQVTLHHSISQEPTEIYIDINPRPSDKSETSFIMVHICCLWFREY